MDFAETLEYMLDMYEHTNDRFIIGMYVKKGEFNCTQVQTRFQKSWDIVQIVNKKECNNLQIS